MRNEREIWHTAEQILPRRNVYDWNQALMDIGATICTARRPSCRVCPLGRVCASRTGMMQAAPGARKREPALRGVPDRIYRGRIVEALRNRGRGSTAEALGRAIDPEFSRRDALWLGKLLKALERDGLIRVRPGKTALRSRVVIA